MTWSSGEVEATTVMRESAFRVAEKPDLFFPFQISGVSGLATARDFRRPLPSHGSRSVRGGEMKGGDIRRQADRVWFPIPRRPHEPRAPPFGWLNGSVKIEMDRGDSPKPQR